jgi:beta-glucosidase
VAPGEGLRAEIDVRNAADRAGREVVQLYVTDLEASAPRPPRELVRFAKIALEPGETRTVSFELDERALAFWDPAADAWRVEPGVFEVCAGRSSRDLRARARFERTG